jgi:hypothetical protein
MRIVIGLHSATDCGFLLLLQDRSLSRLLPAGRSELQCPRRSALLLAIRRRADAIVDVLLDCPRVERDAAHNLFLTAKLGPFGAFKLLLGGIDLDLGVAVPPTHAAPNY